MRDSIVDIDRRWQREPVRCGSSVPALFWKTTNRRNPHSRIAALKTCRAAIIRTPALQGVGHKTTISFSDVKDASQNQ